MSVNVVDVFHIRHAFAWVAEDYRKRPNVLQLVLSSGTTYLMQAAFVQMLPC